MAARPACPAWARRWSHVWIVGASSGIGRALALRLAGEAVHVTASARRAEALAELCTEARTAPSPTFGSRQPMAEGPIHALPLDVTDRASCLDAVLTVESGPLPPDLVILAAGIYTPEPGTGIDSTLFRRTHETNLMGVVQMMEALNPRLKARGGGEIALIASVAGYRGLPNAAAYCSSKAALIALWESLAPGLRAEGIRLRLINPGFVATPLTARNRFPMPFLMDAESAAERILHGLAGRRFEITFPRRFTWMMKGLRILPYALFLPLMKAIGRKGTNPAEGTPPGLP